MAYTLAQAAAAVGMAKSSIRRAVQSGRVSATRDDLGVWHIEPAELHRVFPPVTSGVERPEGAPAPLARHAPPDGADRTTDALVAELRAQLTRLDRTLDDTREDRDRWRSMAERLALSAPASVPTPGPLSRAWRWLRPTG